MSDSTQASARVHAIGSDELPAVVLLLEQLRGEMLLPELPADETLRTLREALFPEGARPRLIGALGFSGSRPAGLLLAEVGFDPLALKNALNVQILYVPPTARRRGIGSALVRHVAREVTQRKIGALRWSLQAARRETIGFADEAIGPCLTPRELYLSDQALSAWRRRITLSDMREEEEDAA